MRSGGVTVSTPPVTPGTDPAVYFAGPGAVFGAADVIAERPASVTLVAAATPTVVLRMPPSLIAAVVNDSKRAPANWTCSNVALPFRR